MRSWIVIANHNEDGTICSDLGDRRNLGVLAVCRSVDEDEPLAGDVAEALAGIDFSEPTEVIFVPCEGGQTAMLQTSSRVEILSRGGPVVV